MVEPPSKGHFGISHFVLCREVVLFLEVMGKGPKRVSFCWDVVLSWRVPLSEVPLYYLTPLCSIMYVGPGVTTYQGLNLGFRFYTVDGDYNDSTHAVLDHEVYILDMGQANRDNNPHWVWEYSAKVRSTTLFICNTI